MKKQCLRALKKAYVVLHRINYKSIRYIFLLTFPVNAKRIKFFFGIINRHTGHTTCGIDISNYL